MKLNNLKEISSFNLKGIQIQLSYHISHQLIFLVLSRETIKNYSRDFEFGIFQSIGFKEFDDYLKIVDNEEKENSNTVEDKHMELFNKCIEEMKLSTRRYAKTQVRWVQNRFIKSKTTDIFKYFCNSR